MSGTKKGCQCDHDTGGDVGKSTYIVIGGAQDGAIRSDRNARNRDVLLGDQLVGTVVLGEIPNADATTPVTTDDFALVGVDDDVVDGAAVVVAALDGAAARLPDLDGAVLGACDHPLALAVEGDARDVARVALKGQQGVGVGRLDVEELDRVVARGREEALVGRDAQAVDLRVGVLDRAGADAGEGLPETWLLLANKSACHKYSREGGSGGTSGHGPGLTWQGLVCAEVSFDSHNVRL